ncbi:hypothetical protein ACH5RR_014542 [Cinchona calisaya]|uniref:Uncharacterized protein n=1 Tax=Cinchona calisaya TaxID=153742 RepID=A0ABD3A6K9_9GENT
MGSCVSVHKGSESAFKFNGLGFGSKSDKLVNPSPPVKHQPTLSDQLLSSHWSPPRTLVTPSRDFGSKEESFFDSHPWLDSDCEDDFFSVNGDFTPSRGNTPVHHSFSVGTPTSRLLFAGRTADSTPEPSPPVKKKKLSELFEDTAGGDEEMQNAAGNQNGATQKSDSKTTNSGNDTPYVSVANSAGSSEISPNGDFKLPVEKSGKSAQCCLPKLRSFSERKKRTSPARSVG